MGNLVAIHLEYLSLAFNELVTKQAKNCSASNLSEHFSAALFVTLIPLFVYKAKQTVIIQITLYLLLLQKNSNVVITLNASGLRVYDLHNP